ncbi:MAG TPA: alpha/beta family hydrolase [Gemmatimonadaceae bacterium]
MDTAAFEPHAGSVTIGVNGDAIVGDLVIPSEPRGLVIFAHGSGSSRFSSRNRSVANSLNAAGFATLLLDLLTEREDRVDQETRELRFDIPLLAERVVAAVDWARQDPRAKALHIGLFGASTGAAAALVAAAERRESVAAVVSRGGRPDLAGALLDRVQAPTLLIVGSADPVVIELNHRAMERLRCVTKLVLVPGATHLFEEPGTLEHVCAFATDWFEEHVHHAPHLPRGNGLALAAKET